MTAYPMKGRVRITIRKSGTDPRAPKANTLPTSRIGIIAIIFHVDQKIRNTVLVV
jgi:hypothetical protein